MYIHVIGPCMHGVQQTLQACDDAYASLPSVEGIVHACSRGRAARLMMILPHVSLVRGHRFYRGKASFYFMRVISSPQIFLREIYFNRDFPMTTYGYHPRLCTYWFHLHDIIHDSSWSRTYLGERNSPPDLYKYRDQSIKKPQVYSTFSLF